MKKIIAVLLAFIASVAFVAVPAFAYEGNEICTQSKFENDPNYEIICGSHNNEDAQNRVATILQFVFGIVGIIAVIVIIIGGVFYVTSQGDPGKTKRARDTILYAAIGLVVSLLSFAIVTFILNATNGGN